MLPVLPMIITLLIIPGGMQNGVSVFQSCAVTAHSPPPGPAWLPGCFLSDLPSFIKSHIAKQGFRWRCLYIGKKIHYILHHSTVKQKGFTVVFWFWFRFFVGFLVGFLVGWGGIIFCVCFHEVGFYLIGFLFFGGFFW